MRDEEKMIITSQKKINRQICEKIKIGNNEAAAKSFILTMMTSPLGNKILESKWSL